MHKQSQQRLIMTKLSDVLKKLKAEADEAQKGVDRWQKAETETNKFYGIIPAKDCQNMQAIYQHERDLIYKHINMLVDVTEM